MRGSFPAPHHHDPNKTLPNFQIWVMVVFLSPNTAGERLRDQRFLRAGVRLRYQRSQTLRRPFYRLLRHRSMLGSEFRRRGVYLFSGTSDRCSCRNFGTSTITLVLPHVCHAVFALPILRVGHGGQRGYKHFKTKQRVSCRDEFNESLCLALLCWCWRLAACIPPDTNSACSGPKLKVPLHSAHTGSMFPKTLWESPRSKFQCFIPFVGNIGPFDDEFVLARLGAWKT